MENRTFTMVKPEAVQQGNTGSILKMIEENGFRIVALKKVQLTTCQNSKLPILYTHTHCTSNQH